MVEQELPEFRVDFRVGSQLLLKFADHRGDALQLAVLDYPLRPVPVQHVVAGLQEVRSALPNFLIELT